MGSPGVLRIYLGAAPGVGKTYAMLAEGSRRRARGTDVVIGLLETHSRPLTAAMAEGLETVPRRRVVHRGAVFEEMDVAAILARRPQVALVDELAHTNADENGHPKRWQDVEDLLAAGIDVVSTLNIQHLESLAEVTAQITGVQQRERIPDAVVRRAEQVELVDMTAEALRRRMVHGNIYPPDRIDAALTHYFRPGNLTALRELALLWLADRTEEGLRRYRSDHDIAAPWETRERVVVGISGTAGEEALVRRAARVAQRTPGAELLAVHVSTEDGLAHAEPERLDRLRELVESLAGGFHHVVGEDVADELVRFARSNEATQLVLGRSGTHHRALSGDIVARVLRQCGRIDVHLVNYGDGKPKARHAPRTPGARHRHTLIVEADALRALSTSVLEGHTDTPSLLEAVRRSLGLAAAAVLDRDHESNSWSVLASAGEQAPESPTEADLAVPFAGSAVLAAKGGNGDPAAGSALAVCAEQINRIRSRESQLTAEREARGQSLRATLATVQRVLEQDLRPRIEALRKSATPDATADLTALAWRMEDLDDLCRVATGGFELRLRPVEIDDVVGAALDDLGPGHGLVVSLPEDLPDAVADADSLARALTALAADALRKADPDTAPTLSAHTHDDRITLTLSLHAPTPTRQSLALRLSRGLIESMGGTIEVEPTPDGDGYATLIDLPAARQPGATAP